MGRSNVISSPRRYVATTAPESARSAYGVMGFLWCRAFGSTTNAVSGSTTARSASNPSAIEPLRWSPAMPAGRDDIHSTTRANAGSFRFRLWINDVTPPSATVVARTVRRGSPIRIRVRDTGAGIDPLSLEATVDGNPARAFVSGGVVQVQTSSLAPGRHRLRVELADYQETRNMENVARILPNTRVVSTQITVRR